jgi:hypothetical protein
MRTTLMVVETRRRIQDVPPDAEPLWRGPGGGFFLVREGDSTALYRSTDAPPRRPASGHLREIEIIRRPRRGPRR